MRSVSKSMTAALLVALAGACTATVENHQIVDDPEVGVTGEVATRSEARRPAELGTLVDTVIEPDSVTLRYDSAAPAFLVGDVILGEEGTGYLRRVTAVETDGNTVTL